MLANEQETNRQFGIWPAVHPRILEMIRAHRVFRADGARGVAGDATVFADQT